MKLERIEVDGLKFDIRPDTSDIKAIREVVEKRGYGRYGFIPAEGEFWIDLGANIGAFSAWAASQHPSIRVHAYEPDPEMCDLIEHNLKLNKLDKRVEIFQSAVVTDRRKTVTLHCNTARGNVWRNSIEREWQNGDDITVPAFNIRKVMRGAVIAANGPIYLKMDIEGTEMPILDWMIANHSLVRRVLKGMVFEWSFDVDPSIKRFANTIDELQLMYKTVRNGQVTPKMAAVKNWPPEWFPAARLVWAWND